ncbi:hypothetical protein NKH18_38485 [Streptomyces sp. M10(2022)]
MRGILERLRTRGAIRHAWLDGWLNEAGVRRWLVWGGRKTGMPAFPPGVSAPAFLLGSPKQGSDDFDVVTGRLGWYQDWTRRSLGLRPDAANAFLVRLLPALVDAGVLSARTAKDGVTRVYGLQPGHVTVRKLADDQVADASAHCPVCSWEQTVHPDLADQWHGQPCPATAAADCCAPARTCRAGYDAGTSPRTSTAGCTARRVSSRSTRRSTPAPSPGPSAKRSRRRSERASRPTTPTRRSCPAPLRSNSASTSATCRPWSSPRCPRGPPTTYSGWAGPAVPPETPIF